MAKNKNNYFELLEQQFSHCVKAAHVLEEIFENYSPENARAIVDQMHAHEKHGDTALRDLSANLSREFITPIDQSDIYRLANRIDDVTDWVDEVAKLLYMYNIQVLPPHAKSMAKTVTRSVKALEEAIHELKNFKKPDLLMQKVEEVGNIETESDKELLEAVRELFVSDDYSAKELIAYRNLYETLENCTDMAEVAADLIERIVIKNS